MTEILALVQLQHVGARAIATIGGFEVEYSGEHFGQDGYRYATMLVRTGSGTEIELPVTTTPPGAIARLEHILDAFEDEQGCYRHRLCYAQKRLATYRSRDGVTFAFSDELADKRRQLAETDKSLARDIEVHGQRGREQPAPRLTESRSSSISPSRAESSGRVLQNRAQRSVINSSNGRRANALSRFHLIAPPRIGGEITGRQIGTPCLDMVISRAFDAAPPQLSLL